MTKYAKILENGALEYAPRNKDGISNWGLNEELVLAAGYLPVEETEAPADLKLPIKSYEEKDGKIVSVWVEGYVALTYEDVKETRARLYREEVDPLMAEYTRKKTFNLFADGEEEALLATIESKVAEIKENNPYPAEVENVETE